MKTTSTLFATLIGATLALGHGGASASTAHASMAFENVSMSVLDLTPNDGVAAGYSLLPFNGVTYALARSDFNSPSSWVGTPYTQGSAFSRTAQDHGEIATVQSSGAGDLHSDSWLNSATAYASADSAIDSEYRVTVAAHSALTISGHIGGGLTASGATPYIAGSGQALLRMLTMHGGGGGCYGISGSYTISGGKGLAFTPKDFSCTYWNNTDASSTASLVLYVSTSTTLLDPNAPPPVPEPATYAMLAAGMLLLGVRARRRG